MSQQGDSSHSCFARGKKPCGAVPCVWEQQPAGCPDASWALQRAKGRDGDGASLAACKRTEPARPWDGAGHGGKRKASPEADASRLAVKRSLPGRPGRSTECGPAPKRGRGAEPNGKMYVKAPLQAGGLPGTAGPSTGGRASPAVADRSFCKTVAARKRKGMEEEEQQAELCPAKKPAKVEHSGEKAQSRGGVPAPAPTERFRASKRRARRQRQKERRAEMKKAALRAAAAHAESSAINSLVEMLEKLQLKD
ncbi:zinc finger CCCH domain-containing protein 11A-like isoform X1 [Tympanuchus pallidicinctus]|uniref:zinc finger CCCH domain-containing protein 11A-like isoform X1 n=1 Tax=Tympanuchus pallidicinctus TaxID=109042 RepID=UPI0022870290|nr:zinc finger CCCH domain-containing protein 11A-like isoform X1 [Tympanuchus pallidicinctus]XP_052528686.1 zinc finger CCCH domain-containing protein 11A-like isoform X1 [Tympanuchus pallidicinctus]XP_052528687.1 zinc finger CCCH domain-containing protein 11A-like isoform X1 [Tympanuchus pallidicinctus]